MFYHLRIDTSTIKKGDRPIRKGLFAAGVPGSIVFRKGEVVVYYACEVCTNETVVKRYGEFTAPYGLEVGDVKYNGVCERGVGNLVNHKPGES